MCDVMVSLVVLVTDTSSSGKKLGKQPNLQKGKLRISVSVYKKRMKCIPDRNILYMYMHVE